MNFDFAQVLTTMVEREASDVHLTPGVPPMMRDKGRVEAIEGFPVLTPQDTRETVYSILNDAQRKRFENELQLDFAYAIPGVARFRVNCFFQRGSISAAFRLIPSKIKDLRTLGLPAVLEEFTRKPRGFVLVTGPTGSGKSTTLASMIDMINAERAEHILTIEDPIEFLHRHRRCIVNQREIGTDAVDFATAEVTVRWRWDDSAVTIEIVDDGPGFPPEILDRIGEPYMSTRQGAEPGGGLGLGLFIAKTLLERTGATLSFFNANERGLGAVVQVTWRREQFLRRTQGAAFNAT